MAQKQADAADTVVERRDGSVRGLRDAVLLAALSDGLLRVSEAAALEVADLEAEGAVQYIGEPTVARVRAWLDAAGIEGRVSGHSLRVGGAQSLAAAGALIVEMQTADRWQSPSMPGRYARGQLAVRDRHRSEPVRRWANTHAAAERGPP